MIQIDKPMPENCVECRFNVSEFGYCNAAPKNFCGIVNDLEEDGKPEWCPLIVQEPVKPMPGLWDRDIQLYKCGACGGEIGAGGVAKYCFHCGRKVHWD